MTSLLLSCKIPCLYGRTSARVASGVLASFRNFADQRVRKSTSKSQRFPGFRPIYAYNDVRLASALNSVKHKYKIFFIGSMPVTLLFHILNVINEEIVFTFTASCILLLTFFYTTGYVTKHMVAFVYYKKENEEVVLSYVTDRGLREDLHVTVNDIVPITFSEKHPLDMFYKELIVSKIDMKLKLNLKSAKILDKEAFNYIFGI